MTNKKPVTPQVPALPGVTPLGLPTSRRLHRPTAHDILNDASASYWLKEAVQTCRQRDLVDAMNDAETLLFVLRDELRRAQGGR